jgi:hypothetical protein
MPGLAEDPAPVAGHQDAQRLVRADRPRRAGLGRGQRVSGPAARQPGGRETGAPGDPDEFSA